MMGKRVEMTFVIQGKCCWKMVNAVIVTLTLEPKELEDLNVKRIHALVLRFYWKMVNVTNVLIIRGLLLTAEYACQKVANPNKCFT